LLRTQAGLDSPSGPFVYATLAGANSRATTAVTPHRFGPPMRHSTGPVVVLLTIVLPYIRGHKLSLLFTIGC